MKAIVIERCCAADELRVRTLPMPVARPGWVVVKVHAAGLNHSEVVLRTLEADQPYIHTPIVPGIECAGIIADASDSARLRRGDRVVAMMGGMGRSFHGSYAEYALLPEHHVFRVESSLDWVSLAAVPETYFTAYGSLTECLLLQAGDCLLVRGATSTVGRAAIQLAKAMGASVVAACRKERDFSDLQAIGADRCELDDAHLAERRLPLQPNKVLELVGPRTLPDSLGCVSRPGYVCSTGVLGNQFAVPQFDPIKYIPNGVFLSGFYSNNPSQAALDRLFSLIATSGIRPLYSHVCTFDTLVEAHRMLEAGTSGGKVVLSIAE